MNFYNKLINDLKKYAKLWGLSGLEQIDYYSVNCIFKCVSDKYGVCVLKIGKPSEEKDTEYHILKEYNGRRFCKIYEADPANGVLLIERIEPGAQLRAETDLDKRLDVFCGLFHGLHIKPAGKTLYPTYMKWVGDIVFDIPRFILNEFDDVHDDRFYDKFVHITRTLSENFNIPEYDIRRLTYVEMCMAICWSVDSGRNPDIDEILFTEKLMNEMR